MCVFELNVFQVARTMGKKPKREGGVHRWGAETDIKEEQVKRRPGWFCWYEKDGWLVALPSRGTLWQLWKVLCCPVGQDFSFKKGCGACNKQTSKDKKKWKQKRSDFSPVDESKFLAFWGVFYESKFHRLCLNFNLKAGAGALPFKVFMSALWGSWVLFTRWARLDPLISFAQLGLSSACQCRWC